MRKKRFLAMAMAMAMAVGSLTGITASAEESTQEVVGNVQLEVPVLEVALPGDINFTMDQFNLKSKLQIYGGDYNLINLSKMDVLVGVKLKATKQNESKVKFLKETTSGKADFNGLGKENSGTERKGYYSTADLVSGSDPNVQLAYVVADAPTDVFKAYGTGNNRNVKVGDRQYLFQYTGTSGAIGGRNVATKKADSDEFDYAATEILETAQSASNKAAVFDGSGSTTGKSDFYFELMKVYTDPATQVSAPDIRGISSFTIVGRCNENASYTPGEFGVKAVYTMTMLSDGAAYGYAPIDDGVNTFGSGAGWRQVSGSAHGHKSGAGVGGAITTFYQSGSMKAYQE